MIGGLGLDSSSIKAMPVTAPAITPVSITPGSSAIPVVQPTTLIAIHQPAQYTSWRRISHWAVPVVIPISAPARNSFIPGAIVSRKVAPNPQPSEVAMIQRQALLMRCCSTSHCRNSEGDPNNNESQIGQQEAPQQPPQGGCHDPQEPQSPIKCWGFWISHDSWGKQQKRYSHHAAHKVIILRQKRSFNCCRYQLPVIRKAWLPTADCKSPSRFILSPTQPSIHAQSSAARRRTQPAAGAC